MRLFISSPSMRRPFHSLSAYVGAPLIRKRSPSISIFVLLMLCPYSPDRIRSALMSDKAATLPKVGYIGLGLMGRPMAENLLKAGFNLTVYNRTSARTAGLDAKGATRASSIAALAAQVD